MRNSRAAKVPQDEECELHAMCVLTTSTGILFARETKGKYMAPEHCDAFTVKIGCAVSEAAEQIEMHKKNGAMRIKAIL